MKSTTRVVGAFVAAAALSVAGPFVGTAYADIVGDNGANTLNGNDNDNTIYGRGGGDTLRGYGGADKLFGESGNDVVKGGDGADLMHGGDDADKLYGGNGGDTMYGDAGNDTLYAGTGRDTVSGGAGNDHIYVDSREDYDGAGDVNGDEARGGDGDDRIYARDGERDVIYCGGGSDVVYADFSDRIGDATSSDANGSCQTVHRDSPRHMQDTGKEIAQAARDWALLKVGITEQPLGSNSGSQIDLWQQNAGYGHVAWCGIFVHEAYRQAGLNLNNSIASTDWLYDAASAGSGNFQEIALRDSRPGDIVILDWPGVGDSDDHIVVLTDGYNGSGYIKTVSGNYRDRVDRETFSRDLVAITVRVHL